MQRARNFKRFVQALTDAEKETLRDHMGVDIVSWTVNELAASRFEHQIADYRQSVAGAPKPSAAELRQWEQTVKCVSCDVTGRASEFYVTFEDSTTVCIECLEELLKKVRRGER